MLSVFAILSLASSLGAKVAEPGELMSMDGVLADKDSLWIVGFYAPWCGHCKNLAPEWKKATKALKGVVKLGWFDAVAGQQVAQKYGVSGYPTIKVFGADKKNPTDYQGGRQASQIVQEALNQAQKMVQARIGSGPSGSSGSSGSSGGGASEVVEIGSTADFESKILGSEEIWIVSFTAPWCGHCKRLEPEFKNAASQLKGSGVGLANVDATAHGELAQKFSVQGYPTIKVFGGGKKSYDSFEDYQGGRTASDIVAFAQSAIEENLPPPEVAQVLDQDSFDKGCSSKQICVVAFLPSIFDSGAAGRNKEIEAFQNAATAYRKRPFGWLWAEAGEQDKLEAAVEVGGFGYPALVAINHKKEKFSVLKGSFSEEGIKSFMGSLVVGRQRTVPLSTVAEINTVDPWDGEDGKLEYEEEFDLSELMGDDDEDEKDEL